jgi:hypothetical protein
MFVLHGFEKYNDIAFEYPKYPRRGWIGVDLDGTLAISGPTLDVLGIGKPVPLMLMRVQYWLRTGRAVKIFTARADDALQVSNIHKWCIRHGLPPLPVTCIKDSEMIALWDDRAVGVVTNLGMPFLAEKLAFWKRCRLAFQILFGSASGLRAASAVVVGRSSPPSLKHLEEVLNPGLHTAGAAQPSKRIPANLSTEY